MNSRSLCLIRSIRAFARDRSAVAALEFALIAPIFMLLVFGILQFGIVLYANAGLRQAVEVGARYATIYPRPSEAQIKNKVLASGYGLESGRMVGPTIKYGTRNGLPSVEITATYRAAVDVVFLPQKDIELSYSRLAYQAPAT